jgi:hypothetical protein
MKTALTEFFLVYENIFHKVGQPPNINKRYIPWKVRLSSKSIEYSVLSNDISSSAVAILYPEIRKLNAYYDIVLWSEDNNVLITKS